MLIKTISLTNFRNHDTYKLNCKPTTTLILGANGCGKTSVLEAIYILTQGKSFRATDPDILKRGTKFYRIELEYNNGEKNIAIYDGIRKKFQILDKNTYRLPNKNKYPVILFLPSDLNLISGSPSSRRKYFDRFFSILNSKYSTSINKYEKALLQRNKLLKEDSITPIDVFPWNVLLAKNGAMLSSLRQNFINQINESLTSTYHSIADNQDEVLIEYQTETITNNNHITENQYLQILEKNYQKDRLIGHTTFGVHRDNFEFIFNHKIANGSASRGETRSIILALKFIEARIITKELKKAPIILLDDVFSELDNERRACLIDNFKNHQVIITSVEKFTDKDIENN
ncbi:MAG: DNA replication and repair protein RecF [Candidatus Saccharibacteria bacterium]|nr:DNA replication and repair protein RecF [Candidatus Saccharibacteria bacterium]